MTRQIQADRATDSLYAGLRNRFGGRHAGANGYRSAWFFRLEQRVVLGLLREGNGRSVDIEAGPVIDIACGSGLMLAPLLDGGSQTVLGLDFNDTACRDAARNGIAIIRGDAFRLPFADDSLSNIVNCQFFNQQSPSAIEPFLQEVARTLVPGGRLIVLWRHAQSLMHRAAHAVLTVADRLGGQPVFPQHDHRIREVRAIAASLGLSVEREGVTLAWPIPFARKPVILRPSGIAARLAGASRLLVLRKPGLSPSANRLQDNR